MKYIITLCVALFLIYGCSIAQGYSVSGTVRFGDEPLHNATVILNPGTTRITNENGYFRFAGMPAR